ncbi:MAG: hypothetical protein L0K74_08530 [Acidipropionibacterium acidipropionici]|nr:hypothetical protein [Acidipropionibacterium acidipropionici]
MPAATRVPEALIATADAQSQVVSRTQVLASCLSPYNLRGLVAAGRWSALTRGIFLTDGRAPDRADWFQWAWCGLLVAGPGSCLGLRAAAYLNGFDDQHYPIQVWCTTSRSLPRRVQDEGLAAHLRFVKGDRNALGSPPRTSVNRTVLDLCSQEASRSAAQDNPLRSLEAIRVRVEEGVRYGGTTLESLIDELQSASQPSASLPSASLPSASGANGSRIQGHGRIHQVLTNLVVQQQELNGGRSVGPRPVPVEPWWPVFNGTPIRRWSPDDSRSPWRPPSTQRQTLETRAIRGNDASSLPGRPVT